MTVEEIILTFGIKDEWDEQWHCKTIQRKKIQTKKLNNSQNYSNIA